jgi:hypothetical protein
VLLFTVRSHATETQRVAELTTKCVTSGSMHMEVSAPTAALGAGTRRKLPVLAPLPITVVMIPVVAFTDRTRAPSCSISSVRSGNRRMSRGVFSDANPNGPPSPRLLAAPVPAYRPIVQTVGTHGVADGVGVGAAVTLAVGAGDGLTVA